MTLLNEIPDLKSKLFSEYDVIENIDNISLGVIDPIDKTVFLSIAEWNITKEDFDRSYSPSPANVNASTEAFDILFNSIHTLQIYSQLIRNRQYVLKALYETLKEAGYIFFDVQTSLVADAIQHSVSFYKPSGWVNQNIGRITFYLGVDEFKQLRPVPQQTVLYKHIQVDEFCRPLNISFIDAETLSVFEKHQFDYNKPIPQGLKGLFTDTSNLGVVFTTNTMVEDTYVTTKFTGLYKGSPVTAMVTAPLDKSISLDNL